MERMLARSLGVIAALAILGIGESASAHPRVDEGTHALERARFGEAIASYDRAAEARDLTRDELIALLEGRALAKRAVGDESGARADLDRLASIHPDHVFARHVPPEIVDIFRTLRDRREGPLRVRVQVTLERGRARVRAVLVHDPGGLVIATRLAVRTAHDDWQVDDRGDLMIDLPMGATLEYHAEVIGLGGVSLLQLGSVETPLPALAVEALPPARGDETWIPWLIAGGGITVGIVIAAIAIGFAVSGPSDDTALSPPRLGTP